MNAQTDGFHLPGAAKLKKISKNSWELHTSKHGAWRGSLRDVWQKMVFQIGIQNSEVRFALQEMDFNDHNVAHFGIMGSFIFSEYVK